MGRHLLPLLTSAQTTTFDLLNILVFILAEIMINDRELAGLWGFGLLGGLSSHVTIYCLVLPRKLSSEIFSFSCLVCNIAMCMETHPYFDCSAVLMVDKNTV